MHPRTPGLLFAAVLGLVTAPLACSGETTGGTGGGGASASSHASSGVGATGGTGGGAADAGPDADEGCATAADCASFTDDCNQGACINGKCGKVQANEAAACDDGVFCTEGTTCKAGVCGGGTATVCPPSDGCHEGTCDSVLDSCVQIVANEGELCADGDACTLPGTCVDGTCEAGATVDCSFLDGTCTAGLCDPVVGCKITPDNGKPCNDEKYCTVDDTCQNGVCAGVPNTCLPPGDTCNVGTCDEDNHTCTVTPANEGMMCEDGNPCTSGETCASGSCLGGTPSGEGMACDDGDGCTGGTTCSAGVCGDPQTQIVQCIDGDNCCPAGCANDKDCLYWQSGVQQNVPEGDLVGWTMCYDGTYAGYGDSLSQILQTCDKAKLLMACRPVGSPDWTLVAMAPRGDVTFDCGSQTDCTLQSNGVGWYYSDDYSWGFAPGGESVNRSSCDYNEGNQTVPEQRLCWHTGNGQMSDGYRCGDNSLNGDSGWQRSVFHAD